MSTDRSFYIHINLNSDLTTHLGKILMLRKPCGTKKFADASKLDVRDEEVERHAKVNMSREFGLK